MHTLDSLYVQYVSRRETRAGEDDEMMSCISLVVGTVRPR